MRIILLCLMMISLSGCGTFGVKLKNFMRGNGWTDDQGPQKPLSFSDTPNYKKGEQRKYVRMTKDQFESEAKLGAQEGSLWIMEGQGAYLFSQNTVRLIGDLMNVKLEGAARNQVDTKINVIKKLLKKIENPGRRLASEPEVASTEAAKDDKKEKADDKKVAKDAKGKDGKDAATPGKPESETASKDDDALGVDAVPTRIVQRMADGNYRVKGSQSFMIGKREFRIIVAGIVREQDFNDEGMSSQALLEPVYDVVSVKKGM
jgi:flagellar L-ring protein FlgH